MFLSLRVGYLICFCCFDDLITYHTSSALDSKDITYGLVFRSNQIS